MIKLLLVEDDANLCYIIRGGLEDMIMAPAWNMKNS